MKIAVTSLILLVLFLPCVYPQAEARSPLPKDALAQLGEGKVHKVQYSPDSFFLAAVGTDRIWLYDTKTYEEIAVLTGHTGIVTGVGFSHTERVLISGSADGTVRLWDA